MRMWIRSCSLRSVALFVLLGVGSGCTGPSDATKIEYWIYRLDDPKQRTEAAQKLGDFKDKQAIPHLLKWLKEEGEHRAAVASSLGRINDAVVVPDLINSIDYDVKTGKDKATKHKHRANEKIAVALGLLNAKAAVDPLIKLLKSPDNATRIAVVRALGKIGDKKATATLIKTLDSEPNSSVKKQAIVALGTIGDPAAIPALIRAMYVELPQPLFTYASFALFQIGPQAVDPLIETLLGKNQEVEQIATEKNFQPGAIETKAAEVLADFRDPKSVTPLLEVFQKKKYGENEAIVFMTVARALGRIGSADALPALLPRATEQDHVLRTHYVDALNHIGDRRAIPTLNKAAKQGYLDAKRAALKALTRLGDERELASVESMAKAAAEATWKMNIERELVRLAASKECQQKLDCWIGKLKAQNPRIREKAGYVLGRLGDAKAVGPLLEVLDDADLQARTAFVYALRKLEPKNGADRIEEIVKKERGKVQFVGINRDLKRLAVAIKRKSASK